MPLVKRTLAIFLIAELGFLGVLVVTFVATPRLNGELKNTGLFFLVLNPRVKATDFDLREVLLLFRLTNWLIVDIKNSPQREIDTVLKMPLYCNTSHKLEKPDNKWENRLP